MFSIIITIIIACPSSVNRAKQPLHPPKKMLGVPLQGPHKPHVRRVSEQKPRSLSSLSLTRYSSSCLADAAARFQPWFSCSESSRMMGSVMRVWKRNDVRNLQVSEGWIAKARAREHRTQLACTVQTVQTPSRGLRGSAARHGETTFAFQGPSFLRCIWDP